MERKDKIELDTVFNGICQVPNVCIEYKGYTIEPKLDFGGQYYHSGPNRYGKGYLIVKGSYNAAPGATWATSILSAKNMIDCLIASGGDSKVYYALLAEDNYTDIYKEV